MISDLRKKTIPGQNKMMISGLRNIMRRECRRLCSRPIYPVGMVVVPIIMTLFFVAMLNQGLPRKVPASVVDLDHSPMSRALTRSLAAMELVDIIATPEDYQEAMQAVASGEIYGFFMIPEGFERRAISGEAPQLSYYFNLSFYVPGSLLLKGFKTMAVTESGSLVRSELVDKGATTGMAATVVRPLVVTSHPLHNPWLNYSYYLSPSFLYGLLELMIMLITAFSITSEIKQATSRQWLTLANGRLATALLGKLLPQTAIFTVIGVGINSLLFHWNHFPMNGSELWMGVGMLLFVVASQSFATIICALLPNPRLSLSVCSLLGVLAFSLAAFSFPTEAMYGGVAIFANLLPVRWYFLIYIDQALNGVALYYGRFYFIALLCFPVAATFIAPLIKKRLASPVYIE
jgi:ABC-2 type transport system permease protein